MKRNLFLVLMLLSFSTVFAQQKDALSLRNQLLDKGYKIQTFKGNNSVFYVGMWEKKQPKGQGMFYLSNDDSKKADVCDFYAVAVNVTTTNEGYTLSEGELYLNTDGLNIYFLGTYSLKINPNSLRIDLIEGQLEKSGHPYKVDAKPKVIATKHFEINIQEQKKQVPLLTIKDNLFLPEDITDQVPAQYIPVLISEHIFNLAESKDWQAKNNEEVVAFVKKKFAGENINFNISKHLAHFLVNELHQTGSQMDVKIPNPKPREANQMFYQDSIFKPCKDFYKILFGQPLMAKRYYTKSSDVLKNKDIRYNYYKGDYIHYDSIIEQIPAINSENLHFFFHHNNDSIWIKYSEVQQGDSTLVHIEYLDTSAHFSNNQILIGDFHINKDGIFTYRDMQVTQIQNHDTSTFHITMKGEDWNFDDRVQLLGASMPLKDFFPVFCKEFNSWTMQGLLIGDDYGNIPNVFCYNNSVNFKYIVHPTGEKEALDGTCRVPSWYQKYLTKEEEFNQNRAAELEARVLQDISEGYYQYATIEQVKKVWKVKQLSSNQTYGVTYSRYMVYDGNNTIITTRNGIVM